MSERTQEVIYKEALEGARDSIVAGEPEEAERIIYKALNPEPKEQSKSIDVSGITIKSMQKYLITKGPIGRGLSSVLNGAVLSSEGKTITLTTTKAVYAQALGVKPRRQLIVDFFERQFVAFDLVVDSK